jgi:catechol 2,3-dioxygenase-like lactoylglutathione lyase family enzyme
MPGTPLRLALFVDDLATSLDCYRRVLGFETVGPPRTGGAAPLVNGAAHISDPDGYDWRVTSRRPA